VAAADPASEARAILDAAGVRGGLVVHVGSGNGKLTAALGAADGFLVHGLDADADDIEKARRHIRSRGLYGRVSVERWIGTRLPYTDGLINLLVVEEPMSLAGDEALRVLAPGGAAWIREESGWKKTTKPWPDGIDAWTHALYDSSGNAVARDDVVAPPRHIQWIGHPRNARHHERLASVSVVVSAAGRLYYIVDEAPTASILLPPCWALVARDAFNGVILWRRSIPEWEPHLRSFRSGPHELSRRLVAAGRKVYVTPGYDAPVTAIDGATGETLRTYDGTGGTHEILHRDGRLFLVVGADTPRWEWGSHRDIVALDAATGAVLWSREETDPLPMTLAVDGGRACYLSPGGVVALDARTGEILWTKKRDVARKRPTWSVATLVLEDGVVLCADRQEEPGPNIDESTGERIAAWLAEGGGAGDLTAYSAATGKVLWSCRCAETYHAPVDVFVNDGLVWVGQSRARTGPDFTAARDLRSGEVRHRIQPDLAFETTMPHHRCHRNRATSRFLLTGRTGVEFIDTDSGEAFRHHWIRGVCQYGFLPCNGLLYVPPHSCACYIEAKMTGFLALRATLSGNTGADISGGASGVRGPGPAASPGPDGSPAGAGPSVRLETEPASTRADAPAVRDGDWPTYRGDAGRSGGTGSQVPSSLSLIWEARPTGRLSSPVVAGGLALVAGIDDHSIRALDASSGAPAWQYTAAGRVDSPPTVAGGRVVFGSADGRVYCLRLGDGQLLWRFLAAPEDRRIVAFGQLESAWPVHGSVLVDDGAVYCAAGRSSYIDGGISLWRLDLETGEPIAERRLYSRDRDSGRQPVEPMSFEMPGALPDVLAHQGGDITMRHLAFDPEDLGDREPEPHLFSPAGFLNGDWWHRTYWVLGEHFYSGYIGWYFAGREVPAGRLLVVDDSAVYGFSYSPDDYRGATGRRYHLFALERSEQPPVPPADYRRANRDYPPRGDSRTRMDFRWSQELPCLGRAMLRAGDTLFVAGPPEAALRSPSAFEGAEGGILCAVATADGKVAARYRLDGLPAYDGMAAAGGRLYVSMEDGRLLCLGDGKEVPRARELPELVEPELPPPAKARKPGLVGHWSFEEGEGSRAGDSSGLGHTAEVRGEWVRGESGTCVASRGLPGAVTIRDGPLIRFGKSSFTISFRVLLEDTDCRLLGKDDFPRTWWVINVPPDGTLELVLGQGREEGKTVRARSKTPISKGQWTRVAFVVDRDRGEVRCHLDGKLDATTPIPPKFDGNLSVRGKDLLIPTGHKPFTGRFDELELYRRALKESELGPR
jgi:outer membrane protein assembly factor BamB